MPLIKDGRAIEDRFVALLDDAPVPDGACVLVPAPRFLADAPDLIERCGEIGVLWPNDRDMSELAPWGDRIGLIVLTFPTFKDGRAYSQARLLRERFHYRGELRAAGDVLRDQFVLMHRAGFDAYLVKKAEDAEAMSATLRRFRDFYQPAADAVTGILRRRVLPADSSVPRRIASEPAL